MGGNAVIVLDTHIFLWLNLQPELLPKTLVEALKSEDRIGLSVISLWETAMLHSRKRITIPGDLLSWLLQAIDVPRFRLLPLTPEIAVRSESIPMHGDPADRLIAATALEHGCRLATVDRRLLELSVLETVE